MSYDIGLKPIFYKLGLQPETQERLERFLQGVVWRRYSLLCRLGECNENKTQLLSFTKCLIRLDKSTEYCLLEFIRNYRFVPAVVRTAEDRQDTDGRGTTVDS